MPDVKTIRVLILKGCHNWVAQCLEHDLVVQARALPLLFGELERVLTGQVQLDLESGIVPLSTTPPAPEEYHRMWAHAERLQRHMAFKHPHVPTPAAEADFALA